MGKENQFFKNLWQNKKLFWTLIAAVLVLAIGIGVAVAVLGGSSSGKSTYELSVKSEGGMALSDVEIFIYKDAALEDLFAVGKTDSEGEFSFEADTGKYFAVLKSVPQGYLLEESYPLTTNTNIVLKMELLDDVDLNNVNIGLGDVMFDFTVKACDGTEYTLSELLETKSAVVLNFWYINCNPCKAEFPFLQEAYEIYSDDIAVIAINPYDGDDLSVAEYKDNLELTFPMVSCGEEWANAFNLKAYPTTVIIDRFGVVSLIHAGSIDNTQSFTDAFDYYIDENYRQQTANNISDLKPIEAEEGSQEKPFEFGGVTEFEVEIEAGETVYCDVYKVSGMQLTIEDSDVSLVYDGETYKSKKGTLSLVVTSPDTYTPVNLAITNTGKTTKKFTVEFSFLPGTMGNPYTLEMGKFTAKIEAGNDQGVYYLYKADKDGTVTISCTSATKGVDYNFTLYNLSSYVYHTLEEEGKEKTLSIEVSAGDELQFTAGTLPDDNNEYPAAKLNFKATFEKKSENTQQPSSSTAGSSSTSTSSTTTSSTSSGSSTSSSTSSGSTGTDDSNKLTYSVKVVNENSEPMSGVSVNLKGTEGEGSAVTNSSGVATLKLPEGTYTVTVTAPSGYEKPSSFRLTKRVTSEEVMLYISVPDGYTKLNGELVQLADVGTTKVSLNSGEVTYFIFKPSQSAKYRITCTGGALSYWGSPFFLNEQKDVISSNTMIMSVKESNLGGEYVLGITASGSSSSGTITITNIGAADTDYTDAEWIVYKGTHTPNAYTFTGNASSLTYVDITAATSKYTITKDSNGYYYINGKQAYMNLGSDAKYISFLSIINDGVGIKKYFFDDSGNFIKKESYTELVTDYINCMDSKTGLYPLTEDLVYILKQIGEKEGWWTEIGYLTQSVTGDINTEIAWLFTCCY